MSLRNYRLLLWGVSLFATLLFIFGNSLVPATVSGEQSGVVLSFLARLFPSLTHHFVRKLAHFCEYALLGAHLAVLPRISHRPTPVLYPSALLAGVLVATLDEGVQRLVPGRAGLFSDVLIDSAGVLVGFLCFSLVLAFITRKGGARRV